MHINTERINAYFFLSVVMNVLYTLNWAQIQSELCDLKCVISKFQAQQIDANTNWQHINTYLYNSINKNKQKNYNFRGCCNKKCITKHYVVCSTYNLPQKLGLNLSEKRIELAKKHTHAYKENMNFNDTVRIYF